MTSLTELAELAGISSSYIDKTGIEHFTPDSVRRFFLNAMHYNADSQAEIESSAARLAHKPLLPDTLAFYDTEPVSFELNSEETYDLSLVDEKGNTIWQTKSDGGIINIAQGTESFTIPSDSPYTIIIGITTTINDVIISMSLRFLTINS